MRISDYIDADLLDRFEFYNYNHAIEIITQAFPKEWSDVVECLRKLDIPRMTCVKPAEMRLRFPKNLMMFSIPAAGEKSEFLVTYTSSFIQGRLTKGAVFPAFPLRSE